MGQSLSKLLVHLVFSTKNREGLILPRFENKLHGYMTGILKQLDSPPVQIGGTADHVHLLFNLSKNRALAQVVKELKQSSSKWAKSDCGAPRNFFWQNGYGAFSIGQSAVDNVRVYIRDQKAHHRESTFQDELLLLFKKYEIEYDEKYVWD
ncbi:MAG TPA: IS200/IS605 family transposase [Planctomycetota bacterium]|nr:IS200/IS605 family transposase [Planctomycetota bacterium]